ncbi:Uncharacterised protein [Actinomadura madurae]|nr:Uncharacterised protein [Actinomadura madurae]
MSMRKLGAKATVAALAAGAFLGTAPAEAGALAKTPWRKAPIFGPSCPAWNVWNRYADGSYNYGRLGTFAPGPGNEIYDFTNGRLADAFVYDPRGDCKILTLDHIADVGATRSTVVLKVDPGGGTARAVA